jgi:hypothetical protein
MWPKGYRLGRREGRTWVLDASGSPQVHIGQRVEMGGGVTNLVHAQLIIIPDGIPASCQLPGPDTYWYAGVPEPLK